MRKEILLSTAMIFGQGVQVGAQEPSQSPEPTSIVERENILDVSPMIEALRESVNYEAEPRFFKQMERRAQNNPDKYFNITKLPDGLSYTYKPDGQEGTIKVSYLHAVTNGVGTDRNGVELGLNFFVTTEEIRLELGNDGTLEDKDEVDLFNFRQLKKKFDIYFTQPKQLRDEEWKEVDATSRFPFAFIYKEHNDTASGELATGKADYFFLGATQKGHLVYQHKLLEIPIIGTDDAGGGEK